MSRPDGCLTSLSTILLAAACACLVALGAYEFTHLDASKSYTGPTATGIVYGLQIATIVLGIVANGLLLRRFGWYNVVVWLQMAALVIPAALHLTYRLKHETRLYRTFDILDMTLGCVVYCCGITYAELVRRRQAQLDAEEQFVF